MNRIVSLLYITLNCLIFHTSGNDVMFSGFIEGGGYTYYTNGNNLITELRCTTQGVYNSGARNIKLSWFYNHDTDTKSDVLVFENVTTEVKWKESREYFCRAVYMKSGTEHQEDSNTITVYIEYNTTITVSYGTETHILSITNETQILIPVMTENVTLYCDAESAEWSSKSLNGQSPLTLALYTKMYAKTFNCTNMDTTTPRRTVHGVTLAAIGSGVWLQQQDTYKKVEEGENVSSTENRTVVCVSSKGVANFANWYFLGEATAGEGTIVCDMIERDNKRGFLKLTIPTSVSNSRLGYYYCSVKEYTDLYNIQTVRHTIRISSSQTSTPATICTTQKTTLTTVDTIITTTPPSTRTLVPSTTSTTINHIPSIQIQLCYTSSYDVVFVGVDDVTVTCVVTIEISLHLNVSLFDTSNGNLLKEETDDGCRAEIDERIELVQGNLTYKCVVVTEMGSVEAFISMRAEDIYTQEVVNLRVHTNPYTQEIQLQWETSYPLIANETFIIWLSRVNVSDKYEEIGMTQDTEYPLSYLSDNYHYSIRVQVVSRLNSTTYTEIYYVHTEGAVEDFQYINVVLGVVTVVIIVSLLLVFVLVMASVFLKRRRKIRKSGYIHQKNNDNREKESNIEQIADVHTTTNSFEPHPPPAILTKKTSMKKPLSSLYKSSIEGKDGYMTVDQLESDLDHFEKDSGLEATYPPVEQRYENVRETLYQSTNSKYLNDPNAILVPLSEYKKHLNHLMCEFRMEEEYRALGGQTLRYGYDVAKLEINSHKNKYKIIYPYDDSRVVLTSPTDSNYINASFISGFHVFDTFIASQAPKSSTEGDFWQMIFEQRVTTIVMLTRVIELGKEKSTLYWPQELGTGMTHGRVNVVLKKEEKFIGYTKRELLYTGPDNMNNKLTQFHYTVWPDHDVPQLYNNLLTFTEVVKKHKRQEVSPLLVHCSAGVGRSGTFICLYNLLEAVKVGEPISIYRIVNEMREYRPQMVQTFNQYRFLYLSVLEMIFGSTAISSEDFCENYKLFQMSQSDGQTDVFREQFQELNYQSEHSFNYSHTTARDPSNADKNADKDVLPYDVNRVILYSPKWSCEYINASYMEGYKLIATQLPTNNTIQDYLQLIYQLDDPLVVLLFTQDEFFTVSSGLSDRVCYWLEKPGVKQYENFSVTTEKPRKSNFLLQQSLKIFSHYDNDEHLFTQYVSSVWWNEEGKVTDISSILPLLDLIYKQEQASPDKKIVFCCSDGIGKSGMLLTAHNAIRGIQSTKSVDVFQSVKQLRNSRKNMVSTIEHYLSCYDLINMYCQMNIV